MKSFFLKEDEGPLKILSCEHWLNFFFLSKHEAGWRAGSRLGDKARNSREKERKNVGAFPTVSVRVLAGKRKAHR
jgi:hypothetical protein